MGILGSSTLTVSFIAGILCIMLLTYKKSPKFSIAAGLLSNAFILISSFLLFYLLVVGDFSIEYVYKNTDRDLPLIYKISAFWSGSSGSLLLWNSCISLVYTFISGLFYIRKIQNRQYIMCLTAVTTILNLMFLIVLIFINNPFKVVGTSSNGFGLNPSLQSIGMVFHPPLVMIAYSLFFAVFASNLYEILYHSNIKTQITRNIALIAWIFLTASIISGGVWAYRELGWGGYWNWDPIENSALVTWLIATAYLHLFHLKKNNKIGDRPSFILISTAIFSILFGTFLARSGILSSVHSYSNHGSKIFFTFILIIVLVTLLSILIAINIKRNKTHPSKLSLEIFKLYMPVILLIIPAVIITFLTIYPLFSPEGSIISEDTYDFVFGIWGLLILISSTVFFSLRGITNKLKILINIFSTISGTATMFLPSFTSYPFFVRISLAISVFCLASVLLNFALNLNNLFNNSSNIPVFIIHISIIIIAIGLVGSRGMNLETSNVIDKNGTISIGNHQLKLISLSVDDGPQKKNWTADLTYNNGKISRDISTSIQFYKKKKIYHSQAYIISSFKEDLYIIVENSADEGSVRLKVSLFKWVSFLWIGIILMVSTSIFLCWKRLCNLEKITQ